MYLYVADKTLLPVLLRHVGTSCEMNGICYDGAHVHVDGLIGGTQVVV